MKTHDIASKITNSFIDRVKRLLSVLRDTFYSFIRNNDLTAASSLAFYSTLALIPAIFLITLVLGFAIGSSQTALRTVQEMLAGLLPSYSQDILKEVRYLAGHTGAISMVNAGVLVLTISPLVAEMRVVLGVIFRKRPTRPFVLEKLFDVAITILFIIGISAIAVVGVVMKLVQLPVPIHIFSHYFEGVMPVLFIAVVIFLLYLAFSRNMTYRHLAVGAVVASFLWFILRPLFHLFLVYNPGYGFAFGSFKSLFVVIIWIYYSLVVFLMGAEVAASLSQNDEQKNYR